MNWQEIIIQIGQSGIIVTGSVFILRKFIELSFSKDLEKFKTDLEKTSIEFKIRYEKLHSERVEVIKEVYKKISRAYRSFFSLLKPLQEAGELNQTEKSNEAAKNANDLFDYYEDNRIFFEEKLAVEIDFLISAFHDAWNKFRYANEARECGSHKEAVNERIAAWDQIKKEVPKVKNRLENEFRMIIGIKNEN